MATKKAFWINVWRVSFCFAGLIFAVAAAVLHHVLAPSDLSPAYLALRFLDALGLFLFVMGLLTLVLDLKHWKEYFEHRLSDLVIGQDYLKELSPEALLKQQVKVFQIYYHDEKISDSGFVGYCLNKIHRFVATPYRSDVHDYINISKAGQEGYRVENNLNYVLRKAGGRIQERIGWQANSMEVRQMDSLTLDLVGPKPSEEVLEHVEIDGFQCQEDIDGSLTYEYSLERYKDLDGILVKIRAEYYVEPSAFYTWRMIDHSERVELSIHYPSDLEIQFKHFLLEAKPTLEIKNKDSFHITFDSWIMPRSGFAWKLLEPGAPIKVRTLETAVLAERPAPQPDLLLNRSSQSPETPLRDTAVGEPATGMVS
jgi:hypothetical protein